MGRTRLTGHLRLVKGFTEHLWSVRMAYGSLIDHKNNIWNSLKGRLEHSL
jgi:hypothetical protein